MKITLDKILALIVAAAALSLCAFQFLDPFLWFDESGQFFIGLGLNHYSDPFLTRGTLYDVIVNNRFYNLDPGGFSIMVYFWTLFSTSVYFLRVLPLLFFLASVYFLYRILTHEKVSSSYVTVFLGAYVVFAGLFFLIAEFRAYSMEICGTLMTLWLYLKYSDKLDYRRLLTISLVACFFCISRYSFIMVAFCLALFIIFDLFRKETFGRFIAKSAVFGTPLLVTVLLIFFFMTRLQDSGTLNYVGYIGKNPRLLLLSPLTLLFYLNIILFALRYRKEKKVPFILVYALGVSSVFFILSICSLFPWDLKRAASVTLLNLLSLMIHFTYFAGELAERKWVIYPLDGLVVLCSLFLCYRTTHREFVDISKEFEALDLSKYEKVYVAYTSIPDIKYQYEFGRLRDRVAEDGYPEKFVFQARSYQLADGEFREHLLAPEEAECDLYFHLDARQLNGFKAEKNCTYSFVKEQE